MLTCLYISTDEYCNNLKACNECAMDSKCGWCNYTTCISGNATSPTYSRCNTWQYQQCTPCNVLLPNVALLSIVNVHARYKEAVLSLLAEPFLFAFLVPCSDFVECDQCTQPGNDHCGWCEATRKCLVVEDAKTCPRDWFHKSCPGDLSLLPLSHYCWTKSNSVLFSSNLSSLPIPIPAPILCRYYKTCQECTDFSANCWWCTNGKHFFCTDSPSGKCYRQVTQRYPSCSIAPGED